MDSVPRPMSSNVIQILFKKNLDCDVNLTDCLLCFAYFENLLSIIVVAKTFSACHARNAYLHLYVSL